MKLITYLKYLLAVVGLIGTVEVVNASQEEYAATDQATRNADAIARV